MPGAAPPARAESSRENGAFRVALEQHAARLHACAFRVLGDSQTAEEIVQDVFLTLMRQSAPPAPGAVTAWLYAVTLNRCRDALRRASVRAMTTTAPLSTHLPAPQLDPEQVFTRKERERLLNGALAGLPAEFREVIALRFAAGLSYQEIAETLGCAAGTVASRLNRGLRKLGDELRSAGLTREMF